MFSLTLLKDIERKKRLLFSGVNGNNDNYDLDDKVSDLLTSSLFPKNINK